MNRSQKFQNLRISSTLLLKNQISRARQTGHHIAIKSKIKNSQLSVRNPKLASGKVLKLLNLKIKTTLKMMFAPMFKNKLEAK